MKSFKELERERMDDGLYDSSHKGLEAKIDNAQQVLFSRIAEIESSCKEIRSAAVGLSDALLTMRRRYQEQQRVVSRALRDTEDAD